MPLKPPLLRRVLGMSRPLEAEFAPEVVMPNPASDEPVVGKEAVLAALRGVEQACDSFERTRRLGVSRHRCGHGEGRIIVLSRAFGRWRRSWNAYAGATRSREFTSGTPSAVARPRRPRCAPPARHNRARGCDAARTWSEQAAAWPSDWGKTLLLPGLRVPRNPSLPPSGAKPGSQGRPDRAERSEPRKRRPLRPGGAKYLASRSCDSLEVDHIDAERAPSCRRIVRRETAVRPRVRCPRRRGDATGRRSRRAHRRRRDQ